MLRLRLSRLFTRYAERFVPGDSFFGKSASALMESNRDAFRDDLIEGLQAIFTKFDSGLAMESKNTGTGKALLKFSGTKNYIGMVPAEFEIETETSDFLMATGRVAAFTFKNNGQEQSFYYGNSWSPDNDSQHLGVPKYPDEVIKIAQYLREESYKDLYERWQQENPQPRRTTQIIDLRQ